MDHGPWTATTSKSNLLQPQALPEAHSPPATRSLDCRHGQTREAERVVVAVTHAADSGRVLRLRRRGIERGAVAAESRARTGDRRTLAGADRFGAARSVRRPVADRTRAR